MRRRASARASASVSSAVQPGGSGTTTVGVDYGSRNTGIAVGRGFAARPVGTLDGRVGDRALAEEVAKIATEQGAEQVVVGLPLRQVVGGGSKATRVVRSARGRGPRPSSSEDGNDDGVPAESAQATKCRRFAETLARATVLPVFLFDEHGTSARALDAMIAMGTTKKARRSGRLDAVAACNILDEFFERSGAGAEWVEPG
jgi:RNase H-fold protein (predicted Holliday junction resolvase)